jgi:YegS/Rv2252/BmrU family lipid kinase
MQMSDHRGAELLVNTKSRRGEAAYEELLSASRDVGLAFGQVHKLADASDLDQALQSIRSRAPRLLVVGSGDGTVSDVVDYLAGTDIELGFVPLGTTNNFARSLGIPLGIRQAVERIVNGRVLEIDLGHIEDEYFANVAGIGISALTAEAATVGLKRRFGRLAYIIAGLTVLFRHQPFHVEIADKDGELKLHFETHQVIIANGRFHAGKEIAVDAKLDSRELVIFKLGGASRWSFLWHTLDYYLGPRRTVSHEAYLIAKDVSIRTSRSQPVELDGEVKFRTPLAVKVHSRAVKVRV